MQRIITTVTVLVWILSVTNGVVNSITGTNLVKTSRFALLLSLIIASATTFTVTTVLLPSF